MFLICPSGEDLYTLIKIKKCKEIFFILQFKVSDNFTFQCSVTECTVQYMGLLVATPIVNGNEVAYPSELFWDPAECSNIF
jgi:hypothetical protein